MTIAKKLYWGFGGMIGLVLILASVSQFGLWREQAAKRKTNRSFQVLRDTSALQYLLSQNQIHLNNYLLSGDSSEADKVLNGVIQLDEAIRRTKPKPPRKNRFRWKGFTKRSTTGRSTLRDRSSTNASK